MAPGKTKIDVPQNTHPFRRFLTCILCLCKVFVPFVSFFSKWFYSFWLVIRPCFNNSWAAVVPAEQRGGLCTSETFSGGQHTKGHGPASEIHGPWAASLLLIPYMPPCPCHCWTLSLSPPLVLPLLFFGMSEWVMVGASCENVLGRSSAVNSGSPGGARGTTWPLFRSPFWASAARPAPEGQLSPRDTGQAQGHGALCQRGASRGWPGPRHPGGAALGAAPHQLHCFSSRGAHTSHFEVFFLFVCPFGAVLQPS